MTDSPARVIPPPAFLHDPALRAVLAALPEARIVGGAVRDALAGIEHDAADIDLATPRLPEQVMQALAAAGLKAVPTGLSHGTVTAVADGRGFEITTLRRDVKTDGRHAVVAFTDDWREDAARRDFTINAMSMTPAGEVYDYFGGIADLAAGRLRFVGEARRRLAEDWLRALRFFRFFARYGQMPPDAETAAALRDAAPHLDTLSAERVWSELKRILATPDPRAALRLMAELGLLEAVLKAPFDLKMLERLVEIGAPAEPLLRLAGLLRSGGTELAERLRFSNAEQARLTALLTGPRPQPEATEADLRRLLAEEPAEILSDRSWLAQAEQGGEPALWEGLRKRLAEMPKPEFPLRGNDALALGFTPGPELGEALQAVRNWWRAGGCTADYAACLAELARRRPS